LKKPTLEEQKKKLEHILRDFKERALLFMALIERAHEYKMTQAGECKYLPMLTVFHQGAKPQIRYLATSTRSISDTTSAYKEDA
jgi:hypothetical protein